MNNLVELDLNSNALSSLPSPLATSLHALRRLDLSRNAFTRLPQARSAGPLLGNLSTGVYWSMGLRALKRLDLSKGVSTRLPRVRYASACCAGSLSRV